MNQHTFEMQTRSAPEVLERILRVTRHRGFTVKSMQMDELGSEQAIRIRFTVCSERSISLLFNQLNKLIDVAQINELCNDQQQKWA
ncbi:MULTISPECIES: acetolactate synthase 2 small subunit [Celerinatantimonas]|uniref:Acetolactate synthase small subunit n=1 Tax=Celerinatantimonas diazotrophica TaxID=412034 RepID=A0A4R1KDR5_9GAMM|nr:acetolactate synthase 2 small subunit [Celerinatantimonas diazotrophica]TCK62722.1 acetolactate synthase small subunit [Celerinatantimonas diazotrophica]CAG9298352.1 Acetolactate synthase isozyme 2 small subunit [Celerinatantimonas diazotrophica]